MIAAGAALERIREDKPLVHQITNYVVMNETANATLALGALPVMAHAREEVEEMVGLAGALVINIGTLSPAWVESMLLAGRAAGERGIPVVLDPVGAGATRYRTETARRILDEVPVTVLRGNAGEVATLVGGRGGSPRGRVDGRRGGCLRPRPPRRRDARGRGLRDGPGRPRLRRGSAPSRSRTATRCWERSAARAACRPRSPARSPPPSPGSAASCCCRVDRFRGRRRGRRAGREGPGHVPRGAVRRAREPRPVDARRARAGGRAVRLHAIVADLENARAAVEGGATVLQLRLKARRPTTWSPRAGVPQPLPDSRDRLRRQRRRGGGAAARGGRRSSRS